MNDIKGIPYLTAEFDKEGKPVNDPQLPTGTTDVIVVSHGWNNTRDDAEELYRRLFGNFVDVTAGDAGIAKLKIAIVGVIWPSHKFDELMSEPPGKAAPAGGALAAGSAENHAAAQAAMHAAIDRVSPLFDTPEQIKQLKQLHTLVATLEENEDSQRNFVLTMRELLGGEAENKGQIHREDASNVFFGGNPQDIFNNVKLPAPASANEPAVPAAHAAGSAAGSGEMVGRAAGFFDVISKAANAVTSLMNHLTYFEMKKLAGTVGERGVAPLIDHLAATGSVQRVHLVGHSFGGRVVSATAAHSSTKKLRSLSLLQAAFSHFGFSKVKHGFFRSVVEAQRVSGPILITHTKTDRAVGLAYPAASRIGGDAATDFGGADDEFGGIGSNGAQRMQDGEIASGAVDLLEVKSPYAFTAGKLHNLKSDKFIVDPKGGDAHGFVFVPQVAWAISRAMLA